jgi:plasmid maintenance system killer protein
MRLAPLRNDLRLYLREHQLVEKWNKAKALFEANIRHPSLHVELLEPRWHGICSFRIDRKYRALFFIRGDVAEVFSVTNHYKK